MYSLFCSVQTPRKQERISSTWPPNESVCMQRWTREDWERMYDTGRRSRAKLYLLLCWAWPLSNGVFTTFISSSVSEQTGFIGSVIRYAICKTGLRSLGYYSVRASFWFLDCGNRLWGVRSVIGGDDLTAALASGQLFTAREAHLCPKRLGLM